MLATQPFLPRPHSPRDNSAILSQSKIQNQQSSFINPIFLHGRIVLVQFNSMGDPESGGRFTVKKYHSSKTVAEDAWQHDRIELLPLNPDYDPILVAPHEGSEMVVVGEWVVSID